MYIAGNGELYDDDEINVYYVENDDINENDYQVCNIDYSIEHWEGTLKIGF